MRGLPALVVLVAIVPAVAAERVLYSDPEGDAASSTADLVAISLQVQGKDFAIAFRPVDLPTVLPTLPAGDLPLEEHVYSSIIRRTYVGVKAHGDNRDLQTMWVQHETETGGWRGFVNANDTTLEFSVTVDGDMVEMRMPWAALGAVPGDEFSLMWGLSGESGMTYTGAQDRVVPAGQRGVLVPGSTPGLEIPPPRTTASSWTAPGILWGFVALGAVATLVVILVQRGLRR